MNPLLAITAAKVGSVAGEDAVDERESAEVDDAAARLRGVGGESAVGDRRDALIVDGQACASNGRVAGEGAVRERELSARTIPDAAAAAARPSLRAVRLRAVPDSATG